jgi:hypothetical protein
VALQQQQGARRSLQHMRTGACLFVCFFPLPRLSHLPATPRTPPSTPNDAYAITRLCTVLHSHLLQRNLSPLCCHDVVPIACTVHASEDNAYPEHVTCIGNAPTLPKEIVPTTVHIQQRRQDPCTLLCTAMRSIQPTAAIIMAVSLQQP